MIARRCFLLSAGGYITDGLSMKPLRSFDEAQSLPLHSKSAKHVENKQLTRKHGELEINVLGVFCVKRFSNIPQRTRIEMELLFVASNVTSHKVACRIWRRGHQGLEVISSL